MGKREYTEKDLREFDIAEEQKAKIAELLNQGNSVKATTNINLDKKISVKANFVLAFTSNLRQLAELNISQNELKIITYILEVMEYGNLISISQAAIAKNTGIAKSNVSHNFKKLKDKKILIVDADGNLLMNSCLFQKGLNHSMTEERRKNLKSAQVLELTENVEYVEQEQTRQKGKKDEVKTTIPVKVKIKKEVKVKENEENKNQRKLALEVTL